jgi:hypothetical protein
MVTHGCLHCLSTIKVHWLTLLLRETVLMTDHFYSYEVVGRSPDQCQGFIFVLDVGESSRIKKLL